MQITFEIPEDIAQALAHQEVSLDRTALESFAAEGYRSRSLSETQVMRLLQLSDRFAVHAWLRDRHVPYQYTETDLNSDLADLAALGLR